MVVGPGDGWIPEDAGLSAAAQGWLSMDNLLAHLDTDFCKGAAAVALLGAKVRSTATPFSPRRPLDPPPPPTPPPPPPTHRGETTMVCSRATVQCF